MKNGYLSPKTRRKCSFLQIRIGFTIDHIQLREVTWSIKNQVDTGEDGRSMIPSLPVKVEG